MIRALIRLVRPQYPAAIAAGFCAVLLYLASGRVSTVSGSGALAALALMFVVCGSYALNDAIDVEVDKINAPERPLPKGDISRLAAFIFAAVLYGVGLAISLFTPFAYVISLMVVAVVSILYDIFSKRAGVWKEVVVAFLMSSIYPLGFAFAGFSGSPRAKVLYVHFFWFFLTCLSFEMLKDIRDVKGDSAVCGEVNSFRSKPYFLRLARIITFSASLLTVMPFALGLCGYVYLASAACAVFLAGAAALFRPSRAILFIYAEAIVLLFGSVADILV